MTKIVLSASRDIPLHKLVLSQANVRRIKAGVSIGELAEAWGAAGHAGPGAGAGGMAPPTSPKPPSVPGLAQVR
jgi:hypothetical protein